MKKLIEVINMQADTILKLANIVQKQGEKLNKIMLILQQNNLLPK